MSRDKMTLYHHTTIEGANGIAESGRIKQSAGTNTYDDARFGDGTYFNSMGPEHSRSSIARNNYDGANPRTWERMMQKGRTDAIIEVKIPTRDVESYTASGRDVFKTKGDYKLTKDAKIHIRDPENSYKFKTYSYQ